MTALDSIIEIDAALANLDKIAKVLSWCPADGPAPTKDDFKAAKTALKEVMGFTSNPILFERAKAVTFEWYANAAFESLHCNKHPEKGYSFPSAQNELKRIRALLLDMKRRNQF